MCHRPGHRPVDWSLYRCKNALRMGKVSNTTTHHRLCTTYKLRTMSPPAVHKAKVLCVLAVGSRAHAREARIPSHLPPPWRVPKSNRKGEPLPRTREAAPRPLTRLQPMCDQAAA